MAARVERLTLKKFRGASAHAPLTLDFDKQKPLVLIFGENGTGKSAIVDALDFVCNESCGSLDDRSSAVPRKHMPSVGSSPTEVEVSLEAGKQTWTAHLEGAAPRTTGPNDGRPALTVLRRSQILRIINAQPKERYEALGDLIGLPGIQRSENSLRDALQDRAARYDEAVRAKQQARDALQQLWVSEGSTEGDPLAWARARTVQDASRLKSAISAAGELLPLFIRAQEAWESLTKARQAHETANGSLATARNELSYAEQTETPGANTLIDLLEDARSLFGARGDPSVCPLCESPDRAAGLSSRVAERLAELKRLTEIKRRVAAAQTAADAAAAVLERSAVTFTVAMKNLGVRLESASSDSSPLAPRDWSRFASFLRADQDPSAPESRRRAEVLWGEVRQLNDEIQGKRDADQRAISQLNALKLHSASIDEKTSAAVSLESETKALRELLEIVERQRKTYVDELLAAVSTAVETMYQKVHPGESLGKVRLYLKPKVMGSLEFEGQFEGESCIPPQAYYSDSHLDTLGICVFLGLAKHRTRGNAIVALDDVLTSADGPHAERLLQMLHDEVSNFAQIIITTHYRPWRERLRHRESRRIQLMELGCWSLARGIWPAKAKPKIEELSDLLAAPLFDRQAAAGKAGVFLEELLRFVCLTFGCKLPLKPEPNYSLGELSLAIPSKLSNVLKVEVTGPTPMSLELGPAIASASQWTWVRSQVGAHFSAPGMDVPDADVRAFTEATATLAQLLICQACGGFPDRNRSGSYRECSCSTLRLHPLTLPGAATPPPEA